MKFFIFAIFVALVILQVTMAMPIENGKEEVEIDPAKLHKAIKNIGKFQKALKQIEANYQSEQWDQKVIHKKSLGDDIGAIGSSVGKIFDWIF